tara:strand:+ start:34 stop:252 length:219 start_codon:yes stop_codon:yes gene_type:complete
MSEYEGCDDFKPLMRPYKRAWFNEKLFVDTYGREPNLSDVPMTYMTRSEAFKKRGYSRKEINKLWEERHNEL